jgi:hypothetical protein
MEAPPMSRQLAAVLILSLLGVLPAAAGASSEKPAGESASGSGRGPLTVYLVIKPEQSRNSMFVERLQLPSSLAAFAWTGFKLQGSGNVELTAGGGYRLVSHEPVSEEKLGELGVYGYSLKVTWTAGSDQAPRKTYAFDLLYDESDGRGVALQPAQRALLEGIRRSGRQSGSARVTELKYLGSGKFRAKVGVR